MKDENKAIVSKVWICMFIYVF